MEVNFTMNTALVIYVVTYLLVNGFLIYLLFRLGNTLRGISAYSKNISTIASGFSEVNELKASLIEIHHISAQELNDIDELKQSLFDIQNTTANQLHEINKLRQSLFGAPPAAGTSGLAGLRMARGGMD